MNAAEPLAGTRIDEYRIESLLGKGGMGSVYKAEDTVLRRPIALKILAEGLVEDAEAVRRFEREARLIAELNHPRIAQIFRIGRTGGRPFYVMEYIAGRSLADLLGEQGRIAGSRSLHIILQAAQGLQAAADRGIIHRDIKPANLMLTPDDAVKIVDFGIAKAFTDDTFRTATGLVLGTPRYMSPEQGRGGTVDHRADIYSLGATFYHMVAGRPPFEADNPITLIQKHCSEPVHAIHDLNPNVPEKVCLLIYAMLQKNPADRIQDYRQLEVALQAALGRREGILTYVPEGAEPAGPDPADRRKARRLVLGLAGALGLLLALAAAFHRPAPPPPEEPVPAGAAAENLNRLGVIREGLQTIHDFRKAEEKDAEP